jgi:hypothetical protein
VNHITGVVRAPSGPAAEFALFAPKLQFSRGAFLFGDPLGRALLKTGTRAAVSAVGKAVGVPKYKLPEVTPAEMWFAKNELKTKLAVAGTFAGLLALNQGILSASGSKQKVNGVPEELGGAGIDPFKSDFLKFKVAGANVSYGNPMITMFRMPMRLGTLYMLPDRKLARMVLPDESAARMVWDYGRSQLGPFASLGADLAFREDWQGRQIDFGFMSSERTEPKRLLAQGIQPYTPGEYWTQQGLFIPAQELNRELRDTQSSFGVGRKLFNTLFMMGTGARVSEDYDVQSQ